MGRATFCHTEREGIRLYPWKMKLIFRLRMSASSRSVRWAMGMSSRVYSPRVGTSRQPRMFIMVDLPDPEEPTMATNSP